MKHRFASLLILAAGLLAASQPLLAAAPKADARTAALVAALQAVSPDPLGGLLGLEATAARPATLASTATSRAYVALSPRAELDQRTYAIWKSSLKSRS